VATIKKAATKTAVKKVKKTTPVVEAAAPAVTGEPKAKKAKTPKASKYRGKTSGMRVMEYQDSTFAANVKAMLTDEELAADWREEFPNAVAFTVTHVGGARRDYNNGTHAKMTPRPDKPLAQVIETSDGKRRFVTDEESAAEKAARVAAKVAKTAATKASNPVPPKPKAKKTVAAGDSASA
jgi:hypothetical protein